MIRKSRSSFQRGPRRRPCRRYFDPPSDCLCDLARYRRHIRPATGPGARNARRYAGGTWRDRYESASMLTIVIANPMEVTIVRADPTSRGGANRAVNAENCGESPTTAIPQTTIALRKSANGKRENKGERKQHAPETRSWTHATRALPHLLDANPPPTQPAAPPAMTANDQNGASRFGAAPAER